MKVSSFRLPKLIAAFVFVVFGLNSIQVKRSQANGLENSKDSASVVPDANEPVSPTSKESQEYESELRNKELRRGPFLAFLGGLAIHGPTTIPFIFYMALSSVTVSLNTKAAEPTGISSVRGAESNGSDNGLSPELYNAGLIALPIVSALSVFGGAGVAKALGERGQFYGSKYFMIALFGFAGVGLNWLTTFGLSKSGSDEAFYALSSLGAMIFPPIGEMIGFIVSRYPKEQSRLSHRQLMINDVSRKSEPKLFPPTPTIIPQAGPYAPAPGLNLGTVFF